MPSTAAAKPRPGTWFALPLPSGGYALGLVVRRAEGRIPKRIFCYFFGPRVGSAKDFSLPVTTTAANRIFFARTDDRAFKNGRWIVIEQIDQFNGDLWPMPPFRSGAVGGGPDYMRRVYLRTYDDQLQHCTSERLAVVERIEDYPPDIGFGHVAMEHAVERALLGEARSPDGA